MKKVKAWATSDGEKTFSDLVDAQRYELRLILDALFTDTGASNPDTLTPKLEKITDELIEKADTVVDILTMRDDSRPAARKTSGATKKKGRTETAKPDSETPPMPAGEAA